MKGEKMNSNQSLCWGLLLNIVLFVTWPGLSQTTWTGLGSDIAVTNVANWSSGLPTTSKKGIVGTDGIVSWPRNNSLDNRDITFTNNAILKKSLIDDDLRPSGSTLTFNDTSQLSLTNGTFSRMLKPLGNTTINLNDSATISANRIYASSGDNNRFNQTGSNSQMRASDYIDLSQSGGNIFTLAGGKVMAGGIFKALSATNSYFTFTSTSTGIMQKNGANYVSAFTTLITNGDIRINGVVQVDTNFFIMSYDGVNTTLTLGSSHLPSVTVAPTAVTVVSGRTLTLTATPAGAAPYYFQWYTNGVAIATATNNPLVFPNVKGPSNWSVTMTNVYGSASASSVVTVVSGGTMVSFL
jgi:hypothetical protein